MKKHPYSETSATPPSLNCRTRPSANNRLSIVSTIIGLPGTCAINVRSMIDRP